MEKVLFILSSTFTIIGTVIGAGFISGRELISFFGSSFFLPSVYLTLILFSLSFYFVLKSGEEFGGYNSLNERVFGRYKDFTKWVMLICSFIVVAGMIAGIDSLFYQTLNVPKSIPVFSLFTLIFCVLVVRKGVDGISKINLFLVPVVIIFIVLVLLKKQSFEYKFTQSNNIILLFLNPFSYVGLNVYLSAPVLCDLGSKKNTNKIIPAITASLLLGISITLILASIYYEGANAINSDMPLLYIIAGNSKIVTIIFTVISLLGIITTLLSSLYPLYQTAQKSKHNKLTTVLILSGAFLLSRIGLKGIVGYIYPLIGVFGIIYIIITTIYLLRNKRKQPIKSKNDL